MKSLLEEGSIGVDMPPLPDDIWNGIGLLLLIEEPTFTATSSDTLVTWSIPENEPVTTTANPCNGTIRWYDPITGRFISKDPIGISGGLNQFVFANNNPVNFRDPFGLCTEESPWYRREVIPGSSLADLGMSASEGARGLLMSPWNLLKGLYGGIQGIGAYAGYMYEDPSGTLQATGQAIQNLPETVPAALEEWASDPYAIGSTVGEIGTGIGAVKAVSAASKASPWVGKIVVHGPHAGGPHQYRHLQIMIRTGKSTTRHLRIPPR